jgi:hypothetical protein
MMILPRQMVLDLGKYEIYYKNCSENLKEIVSTS